MALDYFPTMPVALQWMRRCNSRVEAAVETRAALFLMGLGGSHDFDQRLLPLAGEDCGPVFFPFLFDKLFAS